MRRERQTDRQTDKERERGKIVTLEKESDGTQSKCGLIALIMSINGELALILLRNSLCTVSQLNVKQTVCNENNKYHNSRSDPTANGNATHEEIGRLP